MIKRILVIVKKKENISITFTRSSSNINATQKLSDRKSNESADYLNQRKIQQVLNSEHLKVE